MQTWMSLCIGSFYYVTAKGGLNIKGMVEPLCKNNEVTLRPPCCDINFDTCRVNKFIRQSRDAINPMASRHSSPNLIPEKVTVVG